MQHVSVDGKFLKAGAERFLVKGVTYGTFAPREDGTQFPAREAVRGDFAAMAATGLNTVRVYTTPPVWLLDEAAAHGLRVIVGLPWTQHVAFLDDHDLTDSIRRDIVAQVRELASHPAVLMFALGNEIPPAVVRWHGRARVEGFLRELCDAARAAAPDALFTYVNFPPTSYLDLSCFDVYSFNVYLHKEHELRAYLARLQSIAGQKPLLLAEAGADSIREGEDGQAAITAMHVRAAFEEGACGAVAFAWTDEWWRGGFDVTDWNFGLVDRERRPKAALGAVAQAFAEAPFSPAARASWPRVSVVVCAYNAADTIGECLASLEGLDYPDFEVVVVNDGSKDRTGEIAHAWASERAGAKPPAIVASERQRESHGSGAGLGAPASERVGGCGGAKPPAIVASERQRESHASGAGLGAPASERVGGCGGAKPPAMVIDVPNGGLSLARNIGLQAATGAVVAYTDADVRVDPLWLAYLVQPFLRSDVVGSGGPNVVPADDPALAQCVARAPGGPTHVLLDDRIAEHVPGCNMAFRRDALRAIDGFNPIYLRAGDDVDVCWRLQARGWRIGFSPAALVWHRHRSTVKAYWRQQVGYGEGETWLALKHPHKFIGGDMLWRGRIYSPLPFVRALYRERLNTGAWGTAAFPSVYNAGASGAAFLPTSAAWIVMSIALLLLGAALRLMFPDTGLATMIVGGVGVLATIIRSATFAWAVEFPGARLRDRLIVALLHIVQPLARLRGRIRGHVAAPSDLTAAAAATTVRSLPSIGRALTLLVGVRLERQFWTEKWTSLSPLLDQVVTALRRQRGAGRVDVDEGWSQRWDVALPIGNVARLEARALVEEHAKGACLVRTSTRVRPTTAGIAWLALMSATIGIAMGLERRGHNAASLVFVIASAFTLLWTLRRVVLASARMRAAVDDVASAAGLMPLDERPAWRPALAGVAAGTLQATAVIAIGSFFFITAAPTVWDAADDYFPQPSHVQSAPDVRPAVTHPVIATEVRPVIKMTNAKPTPHRIPKTTVRPLRRSTSVGAPERRRT